METRTTHWGRTRLLYFIPLVAILLGLVSLSLANAVPDGSSLDWFFWDGGLILIFVVGIGGGILAGIIAFVLYVWGTRATHASRQSLQAQDLPNQDLRGQRD